MWPPWQRRPGKRTRSLAWAEGVPGGDVQRTVWNVPGQRPPWAGGIETGAARLRPSKNHADEFMQD